MLRDRRVTLSRITHRRTEAVGNDCVETKACFLTNVTGMLSASDEKGLRSSFDRVSMQDLFLRYRRLECELTDVYRPLRFRGK